MSYIQELVTTRSGRLVKLIDSVDDGDGLAEAGRIDLAVGRDESGAQHALGVDQREQVISFPGGDHLHFQTETARHGGQAFHLHHAVRRTRQAQAADLFPVDRPSGLGLQPVVEFDGTLQHAGGVARGAQLANQAPPHAR